MRAPTSTTSSLLTHSYASEISTQYAEGIAGGIIGAATIAIWFLILDTINGHPLYTPTLLGTALFRGGRGISSPATLPISLEMTLMYTWVHVLTFAVIGGVVSLLLKLAEKNPNLGFGVLLLFVVLEFGFVASAFMFAELILHALAWSEVLVGNLLAAVAMGGYFWRRHPNLTIRP